MAVQRLLTIGRHLGNNMQAAARRSLGSPSIAGSLARRAAGGGMASVARRSYHDNIVEHYENPRNVGSLDKNDKFVGTGLVGAPACGDVMKLQIKVDESGKITETKFKTFGCGSAIASSSVATEWIKGRTVDESLKIKNTDIAGHLKLPPVKLHCSMLAEDAIKAAVKDLRSKGALPAESEEDGDGDGEETKAAA